MTTIVTRAGKGSPLTHTEVDTNFTNLNTAKLETAAIPLGTLQAPSISFLNDSDTGIFCPQGGNSLAVATGGQYAITCTSTQAVGIKTANPSSALHVAGNARVGADDVTDAHLQIGKGATGNRNSYIDIVGDTTYTDYGVRFIRNNTGANATSEIKHRGTGAFNIVAQEAAPIQFYTSNSPRVAIDSSGRLLVGTSTAYSQLSLPFVPQLQVAGAEPGISIHRNVNDQFDGKLFFSKARGSGYQIVSNNDLLGAIYFNGADGTKTVESVNIRAEVDGGTPGADDMPGRLVFSTNPGSPATSPTERMRIKANGDVSIVTGNLIIGTAGKGIDFSADGNAAGMTSELLDDYEEGTFTPSLVYSTTNIPTYGFQFGNYTKIGRLVTATIYLQWDESGSVGNLSLAGLPFTAGSGTVNRSVLSILSFGIVGTAVSLTGFINENSTNMSLLLNDNQATIPTNANTGSNQDVYVTVTYKT